MAVPEKYFRNNSAGTLTLLESMLAPRSGQADLFFNGGALW